MGWGEWCNWRGLADQDGRSLRRTFSISLRILDILSDDMEPLNSAEISVRTPEVRACASQHCMSLSRYHSWDSDTLPNVVKSHFRSFCDNDAKPLLYRRNTLSYFSAVFWTNPLYLRHRIISLYLGCRPNSEARFESSIKARLASDFRPRLTWFLVVSL